jgi:hypothetical protein
MVIYFGFAILLVALCLPGETRVTVCRTQARPLAGDDQVTQHLSHELERVSGTDIAARHFEKDATTINELCIESTIMNYEVYRFLYTIVKADVLK